MSDKLTPGGIALLAGGAVLFIAALLDWGPSTSGIDTTVLGLQGIFCLLIGVAAIVVAAIRAFAPQVNLPGQILGLSLNQVLVGLGLAAFLITFGAQFLDGSEFGVTLGWIGSAAIVVGGVLEERDAGVSTTPPTPF